MYKKIINRLIFAIRNNLLLVPNLLKGNNTTRAYVIKMWLENNHRLLLNGFYENVQIFFLRKRIKKIDINPIVKLNTLVEIENYLDIIYINLTHRVDRKKNIVEEFDKIGILNYSRFNGLLNANGALGCAYSHKKVIKLYDAANDKLLMVCEDDIQFIGSSNKLNILLENFINDNNLNVLCLAFNHSNQYPYNDYFNLTSDTQTMSCYILKPYMKDVFLKNFELSTKLLEHGIDRIYKPEIDQVWKSLQKKYNFIIPIERFALQRESFSDIEKKIVDYKV